MDYGVHKKYVLCKVGYTADHCAKDDENNSLLSAFGKETTKGMPSEDGTLIKGTPMKLHWKIKGATCSNDFYILESCIENKGSTKKIKLAL